MALQLISLTLVVGLAAEARIVAASGCPVVIGGGTDAGAAEAAEAAIRNGARGLVSCGLAGGLAPELRPGAVVIPDRVHDGSQVLPVDAALAAALGGSDGSCVAGCDRVVATHAAKRALWLSTGAAAVDMESGAVARVARSHRIPFAVLRVVCDPADRSLPPAALVALNAAGAIGLARVLGSLFRRPSQFPALMQLAGDAAIARRVLRDRAARIRVD